MLTDETGLILPGQVSCILETGVREERRVTVVFTLETGKVELDLANEAHKQ